MQQSTLLSAHVQKWYCIIVSKQKEYRTINHITAAKIYIEKYIADLIVFW